MRTHKTTYERNEDGEFEKKEEIVDIVPGDPDYPLAEKVTEMAEKNPGQIVVGWKGKSLKIDVEGVDLLENLSS